MQKKYKKSRLIAYIIDWSISSLLYSFIVLLYYSIVTQIQSSKVDFYNLTLSQGIAVISICLIIYIGYYILFPYYKRQTFGKRMMHLKIVDSNQNSCSLTTYILRFICLLLLEGFLFYPSFVVIQFIECFISVDIAAIIYKFSTIVTILSLFIAIIKGKFLHDYISHTQVILINEK